MNFSDQFQNLLQFACFHYEARFGEPQVRAVPQNYQPQILPPAGGNDLLRHAILAGKPYCAARLGSTELAIIDFCDRYRLQHDSDRSKLSQWLSFQSLKYRGWRGSGIFPPRGWVTDRFAREFLAALPAVDQLAVWYNHHEDRIVNKYCSRATLCELPDLEPYYHPNPWSGALAGKRVLVVHPFAETIKSQYEQHRARLFQDPLVLPEFELTTLQAVQSLLATPAGHQNWFEALAAMQQQISRIQFDCAIIGAGAYGLPLAVYVKSLGRCAVHVAGATQILFGIKGKRWETHPVISKLFNEFWTRPSASETPGKAGRVESGCYW